MSVEITPTSSNLRVKEMLTDRMRDAVEWCPPVEFDLSDEANVRELENSMKDGTVRSVYDGVSLIANDLFELQHPDAKKDAQLRGAFVRRVTDEELGYGKWYLFPWSKELIRYPNKDDHRAMRTSRNRNLITDEEQRQLYGSTMAVFGLSVGSKVVEHLVASGIGGKLILGDPDHIAPSNLNRIRGGLPDIGMKKVHKVAREISEADPYIEQVHFTEGLNKSSLEDLAAHEPDIIFDEVDDLGMKATIRKFAADRSIPVVMATDLGDKSIIDVERYDLESPKPFNGRLKTNDVNDLHNGLIAPEEIRKLMLKIVGVRHMTTRILDSALQIDKTLAGLPQLGVTASLGGALASVVAREIVLGRNLSSGRYVASPKKILRLSRQDTLRTTARTIRQFVANNKKQT